MSGIQPGVTRGEIVERPSVVACSSWRKMGGGRRPCVRSAILGHPRVASHLRELAGNLVAETQHRSWGKRLLRILQEHYGGEVSGRLHDPVTLGTHPFKPDRLVKATAHGRTTPLAAEDALVSGRHLY